MNVSKDFESHVFSLVAEQLARAGFQKRKADIFTVTLNDEAVGWLGLNKAIYRGGVLQLNPVVGIRNQRLESRVAELLGQMPHQYVPSSISINIGYLMPERKYATWSFQEGADHRGVVAEMVATIVKFGRPFMEHNATLATLYEALLSSKRGTPPDQLDYRIAVASDLLGKHTEKKLFVEAKLREIGDRHDEAAEWFRRFATKLCEC